NQWRGSSAPETDFHPTGRSGMATEKLAEEVPTTTVPPPILPVRVSNLKYAAQATKSVVENMANILRTTTVKRTINTAIRVVRTTSWKKNIEYPVMVAVETTNKCNATCWFCPITEGSKRPPDDVQQLIQLGKKNGPVPEADPSDGVT